MPEPRGRLYELALRALQEQERHVSELRGRLALVIAAGGIGLTLLTRPAFADLHPQGASEIAAVLVGMIGAVALILGSAYILIRAASPSASTHRRRWPRSSRPTTSCSTTKTSSTRR